MANFISPEKRAQVIACLCEGNGVRATSRLCGVSKNAVARLLVWIGEACTKYQDAALRNLPCKRVQVDGADPTGSGCSLYPCMSRGQPLHVSVKVGGPRPVSGKFVT